MDPVRKITIIGAEKKRDDGKYYAYKIETQYESGKKELVWRRYKQIDALHGTMQAIIGVHTKLPKLTSKIYLGRSSVHQVAEHRMPKLQRFFDQLVALQNEDAVLLKKTLCFFLVPTALDISRSKQPEPADILVFHKDSLVQEEKFVRALYAYSARSPGDLTVNVDDIVRIVSVQDEWMEGELKGEIGFFPKNITQPIDEDDDDESQEEKMIPGTPLEELIESERTYIGSLIDARDNFFPKLRVFITAPEAKTFFSNWTELIPAHQVRASGVQEAALPLYLLQRDLYSPSLSIYLSLFLYLFIYRFQVSFFPSNRSLALHFRNQSLLKAIEEAAPRVGPALLSGLPTLSPIYNKYCAGIPAAQQLYDSKLKEREFALFEQSQSLNKPTLNFIMRPVQVCRFIWKRN